MKKRIIMLLTTIAIMISGCRNVEKESEITVPLTTELSLEEKADSFLEESVQHEEKNQEDDKKAEISEDKEIIQNAEIIEDKETENKEIIKEAEGTEITVNVKNEEVPVSAEENIYKKQMDLVYQALAEEWSIDKYFDNRISSLISYHYEGNPLDNVGYALKDLDGDGKEELLISAVSKDASGGMLYDVYTAPKGEVIQVLSGHERNRYYLQWLEEGAYMIAHEASNSAYNSAWYYYSMSDGSLELVQGVVFNAAEDENNPWFITYDEDWDVSNDTHDTDGTAQSIIEANTKNYTTLEYIPFSSYIIR